MKDEYYLMCLSNEKKNPRKQTSKYKRCHSFDEFYLDFFFFFKPYFKVYDEPKSNIITAKNP